MDNGPKASPGKWLVVHGLHDGTLLGRETDTHEHDSPEEAREVFGKAKAQMRRMGYVTWFAEMYDDQGNKTILDTPQPYH